MIFFVSIYLLLAFLLIGLTLWLRVDINRRVSLIQENKKKLLSYSQANESFVLLKQDYERAKIEKQFLESILPQQDKLINLPRELSSLAKQYNLEMAFAFGSEMAGSETTPGYINFNLVLGGAKNDWIAFLKALEKSRYLIEFDAFSITGSDKDYKLSINGKAFSQ